MEERSKINHLSFMHTASKQKTLPSTSKRKRPHLDKTSTRKNKIKDTLQLKIQITGNLMHVTKNRIKDVTSYQHHNKVLNDKCKKRCRLQKKKRNYCFVDKHFYIAKPQELKNLPDFIIYFCIVAEYKFNIQVYFFLQTINSWDQNLKYSVNI